MSFELEKIANNIERIADNVNGGGSGTASGGGFTNVYYVEDESDLLMFYKNGEYVPFTLMDLIEEGNGIKTIPVLNMVNENIVSAASSLTMPDDGIILSFFSYDTDLTRPLTTLFKVNEAESAGYRFEIYEPAY